MGFEPPHDWYLTEWMAEKGFNQTQLRERAGWSQRKGSEICNGGRYNRDIVNDVARVLQVEPWQLMLPPDEAFNIQMIRDQLDRAAERHRRFHAEPADDGALAPRRKA